MTENGNSKPTRRITDEAARDIWRTALKSYANNSPRDFLWNDRVAKQMNGVLEDLCELTGGDPAKDLLGLFLREPSDENVPESQKVMSVNPCGVGSHLGDCIKVSRSERIGKVEFLSSENRPVNLAEFVVLKSLKKRQLKRLGMDKRNDDLRRFFTRKGKGVLVVLIHK
jgi:hypothetical protein